MLQADHTAFPSRIGAGQAAVRFSAQLRVSWFPRLPDACCLIGSHPDTVLTRLRAWGVAFWGLGMILVPTGLVER
jgi:hypothetical protein